jgi:glycosyltransferase involved in cell wall biosynthesis
VHVRILHVYKDYAPILGGIENHVRLLAEAQAAAGHDVSVLVTNPAGLYTTVATENGVRVIRAARLATVASTPLSPALTLDLWRQQPDIVHLHFPYPVGEVSQLLLRRGRRTVMTYHSDVVRQASILRLYRPLLRRVLQGVDAFIVASPQLRQSTYLAEFQPRVHVIPYGLPLQRFTSEPSSAELARVQSQYVTGQFAPAVDGNGAWPAGSPADSPLLLFVGRLRYYKGLDVLLRALPSVSARLLIAGTGPMAESWQALADATGVAERVAWLGDVPDSDLPVLYHLADLFVLPASQPSEAFGLVQVEAMAAGLPVVCTELGTGTSYVNQDGVTGLVVTPRDSDVMAAALNGLLADRARRTRMGQAARARAESEFALDRMVERILGLYQQILG